MQELYSVNWIKPAAPSAPSALELVWHGCELAAWRGGWAVGPVHVEGNQGYGRICVAVCRLYTRAVLSLEFVQMVWGGTSYLYRHKARAHVVPRAEARAAWCTGPFQPCCACCSVGPEPQPSGSRSLAPRSGAGLSLSERPMRSLSCSLLVSLVLRAIVCKTTNAKRQLFWNLFCVWAADWQGGWYFLCHNLHSNSHFSLLVCLLLQTCLWGYEVTFQRHC